MPSYDAIPDSVEIVMNYTTGAFVFRWVYNTPVPSAPPKNYEMEDPICFEVAIEEEAEDPM